MRRAVGFVGCVALAAVARIAINSGFPVIGILFAQASVLPVMWATGGGEQ